MARSAPGSARSSVSRGHSWRNRASSILDEATSAIDALTEARLQTALAILLAGRTSFVVAHRLSTIRHADLVLVLDAGRIVERGNHVELLTQNGHYAELYREFVREVA